MRVDVDAMRAPDEWARLQQVRALYTPQEMERLLEMQETLDQYNEHLERWNAEGRIGPRPEGPKYSKQEMSILGRYRTQWCQAVMGDPITPRD